MLFPQKICIRDKFEKVCSWKHPHSISKKMMSIRDLLMGFASNVKSCHWARNCS
ncbi:mCG147257 [Mus musculus]|nr:mCG147257 [Mus musculus]